MTRPATRHEYPAPPGWERLTCAICKRAMATHRQRLDPITGELYLSCPAPDRG